MADRKGWTKEPASRAGWTKVPVEPMESLDSTQKPVDESDSLDFLKPDRPIGAAVAGVNQGATLGFGDEISGAAGVVDEAGKRARQAIGITPKDVVDADPERNPNGPEIKKSWGPSQPAGTAPVVPEVVDDSKPSLSDTYRGIRDEARQRQHASAKAQPMAHGVGELAGAMALPVPGSSLMKGAPMVAKAGLGAAQAAGYGALVGAGKSEAEDVAGVERDALETGLKAAPWGAAGGVAQHGMEKLAQRFGGKAQAAETALRADKTSEAVQSAVGSHGHDVQDANRTLFNLRQALEDPNVSAAVKAQIRAHLASPEGVQLAEKVALSSLKLSPNKLGDLARSEQAISDAPALAAKGVDEYLAKNSLTNDVLPRVAHYGKPALAAAIGGVAGGPAGAAAGGVLGAASGKPGRAIANLTQKTPRFTIQLNRLLESGSEALGQALGKAGPRYAAQKTIEGRQQVVDEAMAEDAEAARNVKALLDDDPVKARFGN